MDIQTLQAIGTLVNQIGLPATIGLIAVILAWNLAPALARYIDAKIEVNKAQALSVRNGYGQSSQNTTKTP